MSGRERLSGKRDRTLEAARQIFLEQGYGAASMDSIADLAGVSKATIYAHFGSKELLFTAMVGAYCREQEAAVAAIGTEDVAVEEGLRRIALVILRYMAHPSALRFGRMIMGEAARFPELGRLFFESGMRGLQEHVAGFIASAVQRGALAVDDPALMAELFVNMVRGPVQFRSLRDGGVPPAAEELEKIAATASRLVAAGCAA